MNYTYIAIEGVIGSGKTSLAKLLAERYHAETVLEEFENNDFLPKFYANPSRYAFPLELSFLAERYNQLSDGRIGGNLFSTLTISDYLLSKSLIFASSNLGKDEYVLFRKIYDIMFKSVPSPDLLIYLYAPVDRLISNIRKRGRRYEQSIPESYLRTLQANYLDYLRKKSSEWRILVLDVSQANFVDDRETLERIVAKIEEPFPKGLHHQQIR
jgi:deoxyadenosine/deoxycytidine kinase